jgi:outer membrane protein
MLHFLKYTIAVLAMLIAGTGYAQKTDTVRLWSIADCFAYAAANNIRINTLRLNETSAKQDVLAAKGVKIPSLYINAGNSFNNANNDAAGNGTLVNQFSSSGSYSLNSSLVIFNGNYINNNIRQHDLLVTSSTLSTNQTVNTIILSITQAYLDVLLAKETLQYVIDLVGSSAEMVKQGQLFYKAGSIAKINLLQLQAQAASDNYLLVQTRNAIRQNILLLKQLLQLPADSSFDIITPSITLQGAVPPLQQVQQAALASFPEIKIGELGLAIAALSIAKTRSTFWPVITASGSTGTGYNDIITNNSYTKTGYFRQSGNNFYQQLGLNVYIPIFSNRLNSVNLAKAKIAYTQASLTLQNNRLILSQEVEQASLNTSNARQAYDAANEQLKSASESYRIVNEQFRLGGTNAFDLRQQRNLYVQAVQAFTQARYTLLLQEKIYTFYMGRPVTL